MEHDESTYIESISAFIYCLELEDFLKIIENILEAMASMEVKQAMSRK
jgi:hypothetical protein